MKNVLLTDKCFLVISGFPHKVIYFNVKMNEFMYIINRFQLSIKSENIRIRINSI